MTSLSTTSGSAKFDLKGAGSAVVGKMSMQDFGSRGTVAVGGVTALSEPLPTCRHLRPH